MRNAIVLDSQQIESGTLQDGVFTDAGGYFSLSIPEDWVVEHGSAFSDKVLKVTSPLNEYAVEIRQLPLQSTSPIPHQECIWAFVDDGLYRMNRIETQKMGTCYPINDSEMVIFVYLFQSQGYTWQLEGQVNPNYLVEGEHVTSNIISSIIWNDVSREQNP